MTDSPFPPPPPLLSPVPTFYPNTDRGDYQHITWQERQNCPHTHQGPGVKVYVTGAKQVHPHCLTCGKQTGSAMRMAGFSMADLFTIPTFQDNRNVYELRYADCEHCGNSVADGERHHWAPWALFDDAEQWPTAHLCKPCHRLWHKVVTPGMRKAT